jgi:hypothetical protein
MSVFPSEEERKVLSAHFSPQGEEREVQHLYEEVMKGKSGVIVSALMMLCGAYALLTTLRSGAEEVMLIGDIPMDWGFGMVVGLVGLLGGVIVLTTWLSKRRLTA